MQEHYTEGRHRGSAWKLIIPVLIILFLDSNRNHVVGLPINISLVLMFTFLPYFIFSFWMYSSPEI
ncbi:MAG: hypothetical protein WKG06_16060 [Segetibacter sp.]